MDFITIEYIYLIYCVHRKGMNFFFNCSSCNTNFNFQESYCKYCIANINNTFLTFNLWYHRITADQTRVFDLIENVTEKRQQNIQLKKSIECHLESNKALLDREAKIGLIIGKRAQLARLREQCDVMKREINDGNELIESRKKYLSARRSQLKKNKAIFENSDKSECTQLPERIERLRLDLTDNRLRLELKRKQNVDIITNYILPIMRSATEPDNLVIVNIVVNDKKLQKYPKDIVSATLGYVVKLTEMISLMLGIPLPHKMKFVGSKSTIQQNIDVGKQPLPLYFNNKTKTRDYQKAFTIYTTLDAEEYKEDWEFIDFLPPQPDQTEDIEQLERILRSDNLT
ncbi:hypothetical protein PPL_07985 [Heterostelium album PN500]|uniref:Uncharacterized protein n=1 Tax=Heterostelium pallidum (strain ATCC 26659 / Pp 5 / PN500) TaxID=670386 RepID=D3BHI3_HETP5|nr:hypothetical protein PPL_07985 [Heterostelium album PN500]EFA79160.1 hypothetical protein PPL_07985 [Heterostelium album PN500]|eukprot:XP_020431282.1 hypothetical protein PPL_07985 [Heterostelium album PN500]